MMILVKRIHQYVINVEEKDIGLVNVMPVKMFMANTYNNILKLFYIVYYIMATFGKKILISGSSALLFLLVNLPQVYKLTGNILSLNLYNENCPTNTGLIIHTLVFFALTYISMGKSDINSGIKLKHTIYGTLIFYLISSPAMFSFISSVFGNQYANINGCPTMNGLILHGLIYCIALIGVMYLPEGNK